MNMREREISVLIDEIAASVARLRSLVDRPNDRKKPWVDKLRVPWNRLDVGETFFVPDRTPQSLSGSRTLAQRKTGFKFSMHKRQDGTEIIRTA